MIPPKRFALIGAAGYIAPRHLAAIRDTGHRLVAAFDPNDSVGVLDGYFPQAAFFTEFERFDRHLEKIKRTGMGIDYLVVCSPNYLHDAHIRYGLRLGADVICEKPLVLNPWNLEALMELEQESSKRVWSILQLRLHPDVADLRQAIQQMPETAQIDAELTYITPRGHWYYASWKGDPAKSGGIVTNIGIHLFDMLLSLFGTPVENTLHQRTHGRAAGILRFARGRVRWFLSIEAETLPPGPPKTLRSLRIGERAWDFSEGFGDLHTQSYQRILNGQGFGISENKAAIELAHAMRHGALQPDAEGQHPFTKVKALPHPFEN
jgi:UDP-N-acetyl-2-amino-2-deoxyglucuronate dehydrogenase